MAKDKSRTRQNDQAIPPHDTAARKPLPQRHFGQGETQDGGRGLYLRSVIASGNKRQGTDGGRDRLMDELQVDAHRRAEHPAPAYEVLHRLAVDPVEERQPLASAASATVCAKAQ